MSESEPLQDISSPSIKSMLKSIEVCMERLEAVEYAMVEMQEFLSVNTSEKEMT